MDTGTAGVQFQKIGHMGYPIHTMPMVEIEHLLDMGKLVVTYMVDDFFITATFYRKDRQFYMEVSGICGNIVKVHQSETLVELLLALVFDEAVFTPTRLEVNVKRSEPVEVDV